MTHAVLGYKPETWTAEALCAEPGVNHELFYPASGAQGAIDASRAKDICHACPVEDECLESAMGRDEQWGIWGGMTARQRHALKKQRRSA